MRIPTFMILLGVVWFAIACPSLPCRMYRNVPNSLFFCLVSDVQSTFSVQNFQLFSNPEFLLGGACCCCQVIVFMVLHLLEWAKVIYFCKGQNLQIKLPCIPCKDWKLDMKCSGASMF
nr:hypothetical protein Iba_chr04bCG12860 [Ipomoea batatas]